MATRKSLSHSALRHSLFAGLSLLGTLFHACGKPAGSTKCTPKSASGFTSLSLDSSDVTVPASASTAKNPRLLGGLITMETLAPNAEKAESVSGGPFAALAFTQMSQCSVVLEFRKDGEGYAGDAFVAPSCIAGKLFYKGRNPTLQIYRPASDGLLDGYEPLKISLPELEERDSVLMALDALPEVPPRARTMMVQFGVSVERTVRMRESLAAKAKAGIEVGLSEALCLAVPAEVTQAHLALPVDQRKDAPENSTNIWPADCQNLASNLWFSFQIAPAEATSKKTFLETLVAETEKYRTFAAQNSGVSAEVMALLADARLKSNEWYLAERKFRKTRLVAYAARSANGGCPSGHAPTAEANKTLSGANRLKYFDIIKTIVPAELHRDLEALKPHTCENTDPAMAALGATLKAAFDEADDKALVLAKTLREIQIAMKAQKDRVGIATNHIENVGTKQVLVGFKDLAVFPAGVPLATELSRHSFHYEKEWLTMTFDQSKQHPLVNNLRKDLNDGYALTFAGVPVGSILAIVQESGGASVIALPRRGRIDEGKAEKGSATNGKTDAKRETTTTGGEGC